MCGNCVNSLCLDDQGDRVENVVICRASILGLLRLGGFEVFLKVLTDRHPKPTCPGLIKIHVISASYIAVLISPDPLRVEPRRSGTRASSTSSRITARVLLALLVGLISKHLLECGGDRVCFTSWSVSMFWLSLSSSFQVAVRFITLADVLDRFPCPSQSRLHLDFGGHLALSRNSGKVADRRMRSSPKRTEGSAGCSKSIG